jgi:hypothetical protein
MESIPGHRETEKGREIPRSILIPAQTTEIAKKGDSENGTGEPVQQEGLTPERTLIPVEPVY